MMQYRLRTWDALLERVQLFVPDALEPTIFREVHQTLQDFCKQTRAWREELDYTELLDGEHDYPVELPRYAELVRLESARVDERHYDLNEHRDLIAWDGKDLRIAMRPNGGERLWVTASLMPSNEATGAPGFLFDRYADTLASGVKSRLMAHPGKPYSNPADAGAWAADYQAGIESIKVALWKGNSAGRPRNRANFF